MGEGGGGINTASRCRVGSHRVALTSGRQGTKAGLSPSTVTPALVSSVKPASWGVCLFRECWVCALLPLVLALAVCRRSACSLRVFCMRLVVPALACACDCVHVLCLSCACLASACFMLVLCMRLACLLACACFLGGVPAWASVRVGVCVCACFCAWVIVCACTLVCLCISPRWVQN